MEKRKPLVIYHKNCSDGFGAAWVFWKMYRDVFEYHAAVHGKPPPCVKDRIVYILDFSFEKPVLEQMLLSAEFITILDHHASSAKDLEGFKHPKLDAQFDMNRSGATMAWDYVFPNKPRPRLLGYIEDRDLWRFKLPNSREVSSVLFSFDYDFEEWDSLMMLSNEPTKLIHLIAAGTAIDRKHKKDIKELLAVTRREMVIGGVLVPVASLPYTMGSDAASQMAEGNPFAAYYYDTDEHRFFGLRSLEGGADVSVIAQGYGGGGHVRASGFKVPREHALAMS